MDEAKARFIFGEIPDGVDIDDPDARSDYFEAVEDPDEAQPAWAALRTVIANQIADDTPPAVWEVARDLLSRGIDREMVLEQLTLAFATLARRMLAEKTNYDEAAYVATLRRLPLPSHGDAAAALKRAALASQGIDSDRLVEAALADLERELDDALARELIEHVSDHLIGEGGP